MVYYIDFVSKLAFYSWHKFFLVMILFMCCWVWFASNLLRICVSLYIKDIFLSFSCGILVWFWYQGDSGLIEIRSVPSSAIFGIVSEGQMLSLL